MKSFEHPNAVNLTEYARKIGYAGDKSVMVLDGRVISHRQQDWFSFCGKCRKQAHRLQSANRADKQHDSAQAPPY